MDYLILGGEGVVGSELYAHLMDKEDVKKGEDVFVGTRFLHEQSPHYIGKVLATNKVRVVYHFAQMSRVPVSVQYPYSSITNNVMSLLNVLEGIRVGSPKTRLIFMSSREVYGVTPAVAIPPSTARHALNPYAASKLASEAILEAYADTYDIDMLIVRLSSVYGSIRDHPTRYIPRVVLTALHDGEVRQYLGDDVKAFDFVYIDDVVDALYRLGKADRMPYSHLHITTGEGTNFSEINKFIAKQTKSRIIQPRTIQRNIYDQNFFVGQTDLLRWAIGKWEPIGIRDGLRKTIRKYRKLSAKQLEALYQIAKNDDNRKIAEEADVVTSASV